MDTRVYWSYASWRVVEEIPHAWTDRRLPISRLPQSFLQFAQLCNPKHKQVVGSLDMESLHLVHTAAMLMLCLCC